MDSGQKPTLSDSAQEDVAEVLCVDLDGTLLRSDLLWESLFGGLRKAPGATLWALLELRHGKAALKARLAEIGGPQISVETLPYDPAVIDFIAARKSDGWRVELLSGSNEVLVEQVACHLGLFDAWFGSDSQRNFTGEEKAAFLTERHPAGFAYLGNAAADKAPWRAAREALAANAPRALVRQVRAEGRDLREISKPPDIGKALLKGMRLHQWCKNALLFTVFFLTFAERSLVDLLWVAAAFLAFGMVASATYLFNDIIDIQADRAHASKRTRPFADGSLPIQKGLAFLSALLLLGIGLSAFVGVGFLTWIAAYIVLTVTYSLVLKSIAILDILTIGVLFCIRILAGAAVIHVEVSPWLAVFSLLFFSSLAFAKRYVEMLRKGDGEPEAVAGRGYFREDLNFVFGFGAAFSTASLLVFLLYAFSGESQALANTPVAMICLGAISYWIMRVWLLVLRGQMVDDPVLFAVKDRVSYLVASAVICALIIDRWIR